LPRAGREEGEADLLRSAYRRSLEVAADLGDRIVAFPSLGTGAYAYPVEEAAAIALGTVLEYLRDQSGIDEVIFVLFSDADLAAYRRALEALT
jgi:O-acetyl-ADP-ribose deacetylase (regulator of RNase III)